MRGYLGFTLIEVMISLLLFTFILLVLNSMQWTALRTNQSAYFFTVAVQQINNMQERLRAWGDKGEITEQVRYWNQENQLVLPQGQGSVVGEYPFYIIKISWGNQKNNSLQEKVFL